MKKFNQWMLFVCFLFFAGNVLAQGGQQYNPDLNKVIKKITTNPVTGYLTNFEREGNPADGSAIIYLQPAYWGKVKEVVLHTYNLPVPRYNPVLTVQAEKEMIRVKGLYAFQYEILAIRFTDGTIINSANHSDFWVKSAHRKQIPFGGDLTDYTADMEGDHVALFKSNFALGNVNHAHLSKAQIKADEEKAKQVTAKNNFAGDPVNNVVQGCDLTTWYSDAVGGQLSDGHWYFHVTNNCGVSVFVVCRQELSPIGNSQNQTYTVTSGNYYDGNMIMRSYRGDDQEIGQEPEGCPTGNVSVNSGCVGTVLVPSVTGISADNTRWTLPNGTFVYNQSNITATAAGTYTFRAVKNGCRYDGTAYVYAIPSAPSATSVDPTCSFATGSITIAAVSGASYSFDNGVTYQASNTKSGLTPGTYQLKVKGPGGCISAATAKTINTIVSPVTPLAATPVQPTCTVATGSFTLTNFNSAYTYVFSPANVTQTTAGVNGFTAPQGTYTVTAISGSCTSPASANIVINAQPPTPPVPVAATPVQPTCAVALGSFTLTNFNSAYTYIFSPAGVTQTTAGLNGFTAPAGTYTVTAKSGACTSASASITINVQPPTPPAPIAATPVQPTCAVATGSFTLSNYSAAYTYTVTPSTGVTQSGNSFTAPAGIYTITANSGTCTSPASANVVINAQPPTPAISAQTNQQLCSVDSVTLTASGADSYVWHSDSVTGTVVGTTAVIKVKPATAVNYYVVGTIGSCTTTTSVLVQPVRPSLILTSVVTICKGNTQDVIADGPGSTGIAGYTYRWLAPAAVAGLTTPTLTAMQPLVTTAYTVERTTPLGCKDTATSTIIVVEQPVLGVVTHVDASCTGASTGSITINATSPTGNTLEYSINGTDWFTSNVFSNLAAGSYSILVRNKQAPCGAVSGTSITIVKLDGPVSGIAGPGQRCANEELRFDANPVTTGATYLWSTTNNAAAGATAPTINGGYTASSFLPTYYPNIPATLSRVETISLTVSLNGCTATKTFPVNITQGIFANAGPDTSVCKGGQVFIGLPANLAGPAGATFQWAPADMIQGTTTAAQFTTVSLNADQEYSLTVTDPINGCTRTDKVFVSVNTNKNPIANAGPDGVLAAGQTMTLGGSTTSHSSSTANVSYTWTKVSGTTGTLDDATADAPVFTMATPAANHIYGLDVRMQYKSSSSTPGLVCHAYDTVNIVKLSTLTPDLTPTLTILPATLVGDNNILECRIRVREVNNVSTTTMGVYVSIPTSTHYTILPYDPTLTTSAGSAVQNSNWKYYGIINGNYFFQYIGSAVIGPNGSSALGFRINYNANNTAGKEYVVVSIADGSGGEDNFLNNKDEEVIIYGPADQ